jgi:hypothetical protein
MNSVTKSFLVIGGAALVGLAGYMLMDSGAAPATSTPEPVLASSGASDGQAAAERGAAQRTMAAGEILVYKTAACGCCKIWVDYLEENGFTVRTEDVSNLAAVKVELGVPPQLQTCHTAVVDGYVIEGHVPLEPIQRLLAERPEIAGLAVPGMPVGSPGMEVPGQPAAPYDIVAFDEEGNTEVYESRQGGSR